MSLRLRLLLGLVALVAIGLAVTDAVTYLVTQSNLGQQVDNQARSSSDAVYSYLSFVETHGVGPPGGLNIPYGSFAELVTASGGVLAHGTFVYEPGAPSPPGPRLSGLVRTGKVEVPTLSTVPATRGDGEFRVLQEPPDQNGVTLILAIPLTTVNQTLAQLGALEALVSAGVLLGTAALAWWTVQLGLRPLGRIRVTARAIADGDLSRRVEPGDPATEVGQLATSLNEMLAQIEQAFQARSASEARMRQFMSDASHELRTPLSSIRGYAELFRHGAKGRPDDLGKAMARIESESARMSQLVDDLLLLARLDEGRPLEAAPLDIAQLAVDGVADASVADRHHPIRVDAPQPVVVVGDEARLRQVVGNLLRNAMVHTPAGTPVEVSVLLEGASALIKVVDHGPGVPAEVAAHVFERFARADPSRGREHGGSGLGLAIVTAIVAAHHGDLALSQTPGGGATFSVQLPLSPPLSERAPAPSG